MKCPWRDYVRIRKDGMVDIYRYVEWEECYKDECPFYAKDNRRSKAEICLRPFREE